MALVLARMCPSVELECDIFRAYNMSKCNSYSNINDLSWVVSVYYLFNNQPTQGMAYKYDGSIFL